MNLFTTGSSRKNKVYGKVAKPDGTVVFDGILSPRWRCYLQPSYWRYQKSKHPEISLFQLIKQELSR